MLTGKSFRLKVEMCGIETIRGKRTAVRVPEKDVVRVLSGPTPRDERMVDVEWKGRKLVMFAEDIRDRGEEIRSAAAAVKSSAILYT